ncbi:MAG: hypothetical protein KA714_30675 [Limnoraphis sp. WC205]|nr:hypothetical protein [Limnoraphis sp. WC205]
MSTLTEQLLSHLKQNADNINSLYSRFPGKYKSNEALILDYGIAFENKSELSILGEPKACYQNCYEIMLNRPDLYYCEGYAIDDNLPLAVLHAWLVNDKGEVIEPTWLDERKAVYFGVVFNKDFVINMSTETKSYSILENDYMFDHKIKMNGFTSEMLNNKFHKL